MNRKLEQLITKHHKSTILSVVAVLSMLGTMEAGAISDRGCEMSGGMPRNCESGPSVFQGNHANIPEPTTLALISVGLVGFWGAKRKK